MNSTQKKLAVIGGGGVRSPFLAKSLAKQAQALGIRDMVFMDTNVKKLGMFGTLSQKIANAIDPELKFTLTTDLVEAVREADLVITTIRSGGDESRVFDERTALDEGVLGQETTGAGGFAMALRSVPVLLEVCKHIVSYAHKDVLVCNFTNPAGMVTQALRDAGYDFVYGICDAPSGFEKQLIRLLGTTAEEFDMHCFGLNHLSWFRNVTVNGRDVYDELMAKKALYTDTELRYFDSSVVDLIGNRDLPNEYLYFYYYRDRAVASILRSQKTRGEIILEINQRMMAALEKIDIERNPEQAFDIFLQHYYERENQYFAIESGTVREKQKRLPTLPEFLDAPDDGGYAGVALRLMNAYVTGTPARMVLSVPNRGAIPFLNDNDVVEISCQIRNHAVLPIPVDAVDEAQQHLIQRIKLFERQTVMAIRERNTTIALKALMFHPLVNSYPIACRLLDRYVREYRDYVGEWTA